MSQIKSYNVPPEKEEMHKQFETHLKKRYMSKSRVITNLIDEYMKNLKKEGVKDGSI